MSDPVRTEKILIADNDAGVTAVLLRVLARAGWENVESVADGLAAFERLSQRDVGLLICDLDMPGISGEDLLARLGAWEAPPPVLVISAFLDPRVVSGLERSKALRGVLSKPFDLDEFTAAVRDALSAGDASAGDLSAGDLRPGGLKPADLKSAGLKASELGLEAAERFAADRQGELF